MSAHDETIASTLHPKTATLYSAALEDGDFHSAVDSFTSTLLSRFTPFNEKMQVNRAFGKTMYEEYARQQFANIFDIGAGPMPKAHEWAAGRRYLYIDHNPAIVEHARRKLRKPDRVIYETGSVADIPRLFDSGLGTRAFAGERKIAVACNAVLMFVPDDAIRSGFTYLHDWAAPGSVISITTIGVTAPPTHWRTRLIGMTCRWIGAPMFLREADTLASLFGPWTLVKGPLPAWQWLDLPASTRTAGIGFDLYAMQLIKK
jgi:S-adenosyl methyltransferase